MADEKRMASFRFAPLTADRLEQLAAHWGTDKTGIVEHAVSVLADRDLAAVLGGQYQSAAQALHCWGEVIRMASADNAETFSRQEWNLMADANNGCSPLLAMSGEDIRINMPPTMLWANVEDDIRLNGGNDKWEVKDPKGLVKRLRGLDFSHAWAVIVAVQWFWEHAQCSINHSKDAWWTVEFRKQHECAEEK